MSFVHLHLHSDYSLLDGACRLKDLVGSVKKKGQNAVAVTDHGNMYAAVEFYLEAKKQGIKPIIGCEVYVAPRTRFDKTPELDSSPFHLVLLCENIEGYHNLSKMLSHAWIEGFYRKPRIDDELLEKYHGGLIALSACLAGAVPRAIKDGDLELAYERARYYNSVFGRGNFFLEMQDHGIREQRLVNEELKKMSAELDIPLVATNDCHYVDKDDAAMHEILLCIQTGRTINDPARMKFETEEFYIKTESEMRSLFPDTPEALENTQRIAERCSVDFTFHETKLPNFSVPNGEDHFEYLRRKCFEGLKKHYGEQPDSAIVERLNSELDVVSKMGYVDYYLIVGDFIGYAKSRGIPVGPGRGSGAGSLAAYCIGITEVDPIKYNLIFERFLNPERVSMPDFDVDFCTRRRQEVIDYVREKYGRDYVSQIVSFGTMAAKGSIRDVGRVLEVPLSFVDTISKQIPRAPGMTIEKALTISEELKELYNTDPTAKRLIDTAKKLEGMPKNTMTHPAGVVITPEPVENYVPLAKNDDVIVAQYTMTILEKLGLLKIDFLGLRNLTVLDDAKKMILEEDKDFSLEQIDYEDKGVYKMLTQGHTEGVFQFESAGVRSVLMQLHPERLEDLIAVSALYRPGPMDSIPRYIENRHHPERVTYKHPLLKNILEVTSGCIVYQEQVMEIFRVLAGYSFGRADIVRRAMAKKHKDEMERERDIFINGLTDEQGNVIVDGCVRRGISEKIASEIFAEMESFASYAFNKSHAAAYATVAFQTAWFKYHYPKQYIAALMTSLLDDHGNLSPYLDECKRLGIKVLPPHVNHSDYGFTVHNGCIYFGLMAIKNLGALLTDEIVKERSLHGEFKSFGDFCERLAGKRMNVQGVESLIKAGALDSLGGNRQQLLMSARRIIEGVEAERKRNVEGQLSLFGDMEEQASENFSLPDIPEFSKEKLLALEKDVTGLYLSGHPLNDYKEFIEYVRPDRIADIIEDPQKYANKNIHLVVFFNEVRTRTTKNNTVMAFVQSEDLTASVEMIIFPRTFSEYKSLIREGEPAEVFARLDIGDDDFKLICDRVRKAVRVGEKPSPSLDLGEYPMTYQKTPYTATMRMYLKLPSQSSKECEYAKKLIAVFDGRSPVSLYYADEKRYDHLPQSYGVDLNDVLVDELKRALGDDAVVIK